MKDFNLIEKDELEKGFEVLKLEDRKEFVMADASFMAAPEDVNSLSFDKG